MMDKSANETNWQVCRICLECNEEQMLRIYSPHAKNNNLSRKIEECGGIPLKNSKQFPDTICGSCLQLLELAYKFRTLYQQTQQQLASTTNTEDETMYTNSIPSAYDSNEPTEYVSDNGSRMSFKVDIIENHFDGSENIYELENVPSDEESTFVVEYLTAQEEHIPLVEEERSSLQFISDEETEQPKEFHESKPIDFQVLSNEESNASHSAVKPNIDEVTVSEEEKQIFLNAEVIENPVIVETLQKRKRKEAPHICCICGNIYAEKAKLTLHLKTHAKVKRHKCEICNKTFSQTPQLSRHMNSHTGNRPYNCRYCTATFADPSTCIKHERIHTKERPYSCANCGKSFAYSNVLKVHMLTHSGEKPYSCRFCSKRFTQSHHKRKHEKTHSNNAVKKQLEEDVELLT